MKSKFWVTILLVAFSPLVAMAQQGKSSLTPVQFEGKGLFKQRCAVCHMPTIVGRVNGETVLSTTRTYGPLLSKDLVIPAEDAIREQIMQGSARMPAFRYGLKPEQITAILEYLKTVDKSSLKSVAGATTNFD